MFIACFYIAHTYDLSKINGTYNFVTCDNYFYQMNKTYRAQGAIFILSTRLLVPQLKTDGTYLVTCHAKARTGIDESHLNASDFPCGVWVADLATQLVLPDDKKARQILQ